jgi:nucleoid-associated protein YgaU
VLDSVDYDEGGNVVIGGRAQPGSILHVYLDNALVGTAVAQSGGRWHVRPDHPVNEGLHTLRVDQVQQTGQVMARVESPFSRAEPVNALPGQAVVVVQPGNSLWRIARRTYGEGLRYSVIYQANRSQIADPDLIYPGQVFVVPKIVQN